MVLAPLRVLGSDSGGEAKHDEAVAADGEPLLREPELVAAAAVGAAAGHDGRERPRGRAAQRRAGPAHQRRPHRRHLHLAARPRRPRLRLPPRRDRAIPGTPPNSVRDTSSTTITITSFDACSRLLTVASAIAAPQWDILAHAKQVQEVLRIPNGSNPDNCVSVLRVSNQPLIFISFLLH